MLDRKVHAAEVRMRRDPTRTTCTEYWHERRRAGLTLGPLEIELAIEKLLQTKRCNFTGWDPTYNLTDMDVAIDTLPRHVAGLQLPPGVTVGVAEVRTVIARKLNLGHQMQVNYTSCIIQRGRGADVGSHFTAQVSPLVDWLIRPAEKADEAAHKTIGALRTKLREGYPCAGRRGMQGWPPSETFVVGAAPCRGAVCDYIHRCYVCRKAVETTHGELLARENDARDLIPYWGFGDSWFCTPCWIRLLEEEKRVRTA